MATELSKELIGIIGTVVGVLAGYGISYFTTQAKIKHDEKLERNRRQLSKLEHAHELFSKVSHQTGLFNAQILMYLTHDIPMDPQKIGEKFPIDKLQMYVDFYSPEVSLIVNKIKIKWFEYARVIVEVILKPNKTSKEIADCIIKSTEFYTEIDELCKQGKDQIVQMSKKYL